MTLPRIRRPVLVALAALVLAGAGAGLTRAAFSAKTDSSGNSVSAAPDYRAPTVSRQTVTKAAGGIGGYIAQNTQFYVYAQVTDTGNPASGIAPPVNATATLPTYGLQTISMSAGSYSVGGLTYNYRTAVQTLPPLGAGTITGSIDADDVAGNSGSSPGSFVVDNSGGTETTVQTANGGTAGRPDNGDSITYTFSEPPEPISVLPAWTDPSSSQTVNVHIDDNAGATGNDTLVVYTTSGRLGTVDLGRSDYVAANRTYNASTMTATGNTVNVVLGGASGAGTTAAASGTMSWNASTQVTDRAGNPFAGNTVSETGTDRDF